MASVGHAIWLYVNCYLARSGPREGCFLACTAVGLRRNFLSWSGTKRWLLLLLRQPIEDRLELSDSLFKHRILIFDTSKLLIELPLVPSYVRLRLILSLVLLNAHQLFNAPQLSLHSIAS